MASLSNHLEGLNLDKKRDLGAIPKSASAGCVPVTSTNAPSTPSSNPKNRRNRRNRQKTKQNASNNSSNSANLLQTSPSASELSSNLSCGDRRVPEIPELPELLPLLEQACQSKASEKLPVKEGYPSNGKNNDNFGTQPGNVDSPKVTNKKGGSRRNRRLAAGKRKKPVEDGLLPTENRKDRGKGIENKENSKAFNEDFPHIDESDIGTTSLF
jgi:hypothetical protein